MGRPPAGERARTELKAVRLSTDELGAAERVAEHLELNSLSAALRAGVLFLDQHFKQKDGKK